MNSIGALRRVERWLQAFVQDFAAGQTPSCIKITPPQGERPTKAEVAASVTMTLGRSVTEDETDDSEYIIIEQHRFPRSYLRRRSTKPKKERRSEREKLSQGLRQTTGPKVLRKTSTMW